MNGSTRVARHAELEPELAGERLDKAAARLFPEFSRTQLAAWIKVGALTVDGARRAPSDRLVGGEQIAIDAQAQTGARWHSAQQVDFGIVYEDDDVIVVDKPPGLVTAPTPESDKGNLLELLQRTRKTWLVHRIDRDTSGLLVFAKTAEANKVLAERFVHHDIERAYIAVVVGEVADAMTIDAPIDGKRAVTHVTVTERLAEATVLECRLETGRGHQIRIHLAGRGHPVLGDTRHGGEVARRFSLRPPRLALHAAVLGFAHPRTGAPMRFEAPLPDDLARWLAALRSAR
jgi:23S rRNA pseudouridine1911/1915/1917 synthase